MKLHQHVSHCKLVCCLPERLTVHYTVGCVTFGEQWWFDIFFFSINWKSFCVCYLYQMIRLTLTDLWLHFCLFPCIIIWDLKKNCDGLTTFKSCLAQPMHKVYPYSTDPVLLYSVFIRLQNGTKFFLDSRLGPTLSCLLKEKRQISKISNSTQTKHSLLIKSRWGRKCRRF